MTEYIEVKPAFSIPQSLYKVDLPASVTTIGTDALSYIYNLTTIISRNPTPPTWDGKLETTYSVPRRIYVPDESLTTYKAASGWSTHAAYIYPLSQYNP